MTISLVQFKENFRKEYAVTNAVKNTAPNFSVFLEISKLVIIVCMFVSHLPVDHVGTFCREYQTSVLIGENETLLIWSSLVVTDIKFKWHYLDHVLNDTLFTRQF